MAERELSDKQIEQRRQAKTKHGAHSYLARTKAGQSITVSMAEVERSILLEVETDGPRDRVRKQAIRFGAAAEMLWGNMQTSPEAFDAGLTKWGWLAGAEIRAWRDWHALGGKGDGGDTLDGLLRGNDDKD